MSDHQTEEDVRRDLNSLRKQFKNWQGDHIFDGPDCIFCGAFGPIEEDDPCVLAMEAQKVRSLAMLEASNVLNDIADPVVARQRILALSELPSIYLAIPRAAMERVVVSILEEPKLVEHAELFKGFLR